MTDSYVLDTNALLHHAKGSRGKLGPRAAEVFARFEARDATLYVPAVVLMEVWFLEHRSHELPESMTAWWSRAERAGVVGIALEPADVVAARDLAWAHRDPYDRLIVATALRLGAPLVTGDRTIREWGGVEVVW